MPPRSAPLIADVPREGAPAVSITIPLRLIGTVLAIVVAALLLALSSWSVDDPSLSYASARHSVHNWLGFPGAVIADLGFQFFGLAIFVFIAPMALWAWHLIRRRVPSRMPLRLIAWLAATVLSAGVLAFVAVPASWPLPTGLGGLVGQGFENLATNVAGAPPKGVMSALFALVLLSPTLAVLWVALGLRASSLANAARAGGSAVAARGRVKAPADESRESPGTAFFDIVLGGAVHLAYSAQTAFRRARHKARERRAAQEAEEAKWREQAIEPRLDAAFAALNGGPAGAEHEVSVTPRRPINIQTGPEPRFDADDDADAENEAYADMADAEADFAEADDVFEPQAYRQPAPAPRPEPRIVPAPQPAAPRVSAPAPRPVPGTREVREAQASFFGGDPEGFELPALSLLAEPRQKGLADEHRPERLEAMARRLEGVLEDFGVKGDIINVRPGPVVTLYELEPAPGIKSSRVISLADDIARSMSAIAARVAVVPGRNAIGIELPNESRETV
ncbi:MAG TPA: DNA translocase FtsK 4TM domain-containing protein, partial [Devosiaceae bacterium]|nr:DNA translocase FtsK 4TM domain-containing protein [Devosiaceae bacterium]